MNVNYVTLLVISEVEEVCSALQSLDYDAVVVAADEGLTVVIPNYGYDIGLDLAEELSSELETGLVHWLVEDSERVGATIYYDGDELQDYTFNPLPPSGAPVPVPNSPKEPDPELFMQFGSDRMNPDRLRWALLGPQLGRVDPPPHHAEQQLRGIIEALGLNPDLFALDYDQALAAGLAGAVHVLFDETTDDVTT